MKHKHIVFYSILQIKSQEIYEAQLVLYNNFSLIMKIFQLTFIKMNWVKTSVLLRQSIDYIIRRHQSKALLKVSNLFKKSLVP